MSQVLDAMFEKFFTEGEHIIDQDDDGDNFYVIERWAFTTWHTHYHIIDLKMNIIVK